MTDHYWYCPDCHARRDLAGLDAPCPKCGGEMIAYGVYPPLPCLPIVEPTDELLARMIATQSRCVVSPVVTDDD